ncbi:MAG TPA: NADP-dependent phosphogluconate dehydrogenase [Armatimonadota bacterium]|nr:NADP-dependent phosphogluconate dehydrogenase [Armatimonadota bacterium]
MSQAQVGLIGLAVMGENLALNIEEKGFPIAVFNRTTSKVDELLAREPGKKLIGCHTIPEFVQAIQRPRRIIILVKAGPAVDQTMEALRPHLEPGDIVIDGGNSWFLDTERRSKEYAAHGLNFFGMGVSGGEEGARHGPSLMPGGSDEGYAALEPVLVKIAAQVDDGPCVTHVGPGGAGHYVKMVHNGIEYGDMQLIAEAYDVLHRVGGLSAAELHDVFADWNSRELQSFLIEITRDIFAKQDPETGKPLVEVVMDTAGMKGTGKWTSQNALDLGAAIPTINAAVEARILSSFKAERVAASSILTGPDPSKVQVDRDRLVDQVRDALYAAKICSYAQGMALLRAASVEYKYELDLAELARIWKGGCIIRAQLLDQISRAYRRNPALPNLLVDPEFAAEINARQSAWRDVVALATQAGIPVLGMSNSLGYYDSYRTARLPINLVQAQRDYFGAHTYQRIDREGTFHTEWTAHKAS